MAVACRPVWLACSAVNLCASMCFHAPQGKHVCLLSGEGGVWPQAHELPWCAWAPWHFGLVHPEADACNATLLAEAGAASRMRVAAARPAMLPSPTQLPMPTHPGPSLNLLPCTPFSPLQATA